MPNSLNQPTANFSDTYRHQICPLNMNPPGAGSGVHKKSNCSSLQDMAVGVTHHTLEVRHHNLLHEPPHALQQPQTTIIMAVE